MFERLHLAASQAVLVHVVLEEAGGADGHGAVQKNLQRGGHHALGLEQTNGMQHHLRAANRKHGDHRNATARGQTLQGRAQFF
ncbi:hypothetical protein D3C86_1956240 [compost metagenome]